MDMWRFNTRQTWGIMLISAACLAYEITLTRLFAVQQFYHFAFVVISIATMGFAASGLFLSIRRVRPETHLLAAAFSAAVLVAYLTINILPFDSYSIAWEPRQWWILLLYFVLSGAPFLAAGWTIGSALDEAGTQAYQPYAANMIGAAIGCPLALVCIDLLGGEGTIGFIIALGLLASLVLRGNMKFALVITPAAILAMLAFIIPLKPLELNLSPYKTMSTARLASGSRLTLTDWGPTTRLDAIEYPGLHSFPGLSLNLLAELPDQVGVFLDGEGPFPITHIEPEDPNTAVIAGRLPSSLAYSLRSSNEALILDWGAGSPALFALTHIRTKVWLPTDEPIVTELLRGRYSEYSYTLLDRPDVVVLDRTARGVLASDDHQYDVIEFALSDMFRPVTSGAFSLGEDYLLTVDAFMDAWNHLNPHGILVITRWIGTPPSDAARTWNTLLAALHRAGVQDIDAHLIAFRGIRTATMLASPQAFDRSELKEVRQFLQRNAFDPLVLPDLNPSEINRFNRLPSPVYYKIFNRLLDDPGFARSYTFRLDPPMDNKPYFHHFFRWGQTPEILASLGLFWQPFGGSGYFVLLVLMGLMALLAALLIGASLVFSKRSLSPPQPGYKAMLYFSSLGAAYLLVEIPLIQQFTLLLDHPAKSLASVLFILLFGSGIGSWLSPRIKLKTAFMGLLGYLGLALMFIPILIHLLLPADGLIRWLVTVVLLTPIAVAMGIPFAKGLHRLEQLHTGWIPWSWAVNGAFSGISGVAATMISLDAGFQITLVTGWCAYLLAFATAGFSSEDMNLRRKTIGS
jgi:hypothetical protein